VTTGGQVQNGKAFEWAVVDVLVQSLGLSIAASERVKVCRDAFDSLSSKSRASMHHSANAAVKHILELEQQSAVLESATSVQLLDDASGISGDVRDVVIWSPLGSIGISCKNNHDAFKHSRLSGRIDFVKVWGLSEQGCSPRYWDAVGPIFSELRTIQQDSFRTAEWRFLEDVPGRYYWPVLDAFGDEIQRQCALPGTSESEVIKRLMDYVIGRNDFYKVIRRASKQSVEILGFNLHGTLSIPKSAYSRRLVSIENKNGSEYAKFLHLSKHVFKFRIHSASSRVEPSLKFDIRAESLPSDVYLHHIKLD
jgi:hypothetical protein